MFARNDQPRRGRVKSDPQGSAGFRFSGRPCNAAIHIPPSESRWPVHLDNPGAAGPVLSLARQRQGGQQPCGPRRGSPDPVAGHAQRDRAVSTGIAATADLAASAARSNDDCWHRETLYVSMDCELIAHCERISIDDRRLHCGTWARAMRVRRGTGEAREYESCRPTRLTPARRRRPG